MTVRRAMARFAPRLAALALLAGAAGAGAHEIDHTVSRGSAVVVAFTFPDGTPFSHESYELFPPAEETPFAVGRTDARGRVAFLPDRDGKWRLRVFSEDGHGAEIVVPASPAVPGGNGTGGAVIAPREDAPAPGHASGGDPSRASRIALGVGIILGIFGMLGMMQGRRRKS